MSSKEDLKILVLGYHDHTAVGHTLSYYKGLKADGFKVCHLSLFAGYNKEHDEDIKYYYPFIGKWKWGFYWIIFKRNIFSFFSGKEIKKENCYYNVAGVFEKDAKSIIKKAGFIPNIIILGWVDFFLSPKTIYGLYMMTKANIIISMVDAHIIGGGCHFPCECKQYETGCLECPAISNKKIARNIFRDKTRYFKDLPFVLVGSNYDISRAQKVPYLQGKEYFPVINTPSIPFSLRKEDARRKLKISNDRFVILCGASSIADTRKGFKYIIESIQKFCLDNKIEREVMLVIAGNGNYDNTSSCNNLTVLTPGYLDMNTLFTYFFASDLFVSASLDDSGPVMINYSISCGIPVVSFPTGVAFDLVIPQKTGYIAKLGDVDDLAKGIYFFYKMSKEEWQRYSNNCISLMQSLKDANQVWYLKLVEKIEKGELKYQ